VIRQAAAQLGEPDADGRLHARMLARRLIGAPEQAALFDDGTHQRSVAIRLKGVRVERSRQFWDVYLAPALWRGVGLDDFCRQVLTPGKEQFAWEKIAAVLVAALSDLLQLDACMSIKTVCIADSMSCSNTKRRSKRIYPSATASCSQSRASRLTTANEPRPAIQFVCA